MPTWRPWAVSAWVYAGLSALMGRDVIAGLWTSVAPDAGDPVFTAGLLYWNATQVPLTHAWWQLPIYDPTRDTMAFSEHLLGLSVLSTPLYWLTRDPIVVQNVTLLLTAPLCGLAMFALVRRLTGSSGAAFLGGLAFAFAPYRAGQMSHVHVLAAFWAPLALLGLHAYLDTRRRRWLVVYAGAWFLQVTTNAYMLVLLSVVAALWVLWFVIARRRWRELAAIGVATALALLPLLPILATYVSVHQGHGLTRSVGEMREFSADLVSVFCASDRLTFWSWLRVHCRAEAELFPGIALAAFGLLAAWCVLRARDRDATPPAETSGQTWPHRAVAFARAALLLVAGGNVGVILSVLASGPWRIEAGPLDVSATTIEKPLLVAAGALVAWIVLAPGLREAVRRGSTLGFYAVAALITWVLALGPTMVVLGRPIAVDGPFALLTLFPGVGGLRVPARFWLMTLLCLIVAAALAGSAAFRGRSRRLRATAFLVAAAAVLVDGWMRIPVVPAPRSAPAPHSLEGERVMELVPFSDVDFAAGYRAILGGWRAINGYSGYFPSYYPALAATFRAEEDSGLDWARDAGAVHVIVPLDAPRLVALVERQPGAILTGRNAWAAQYRLPRRPLVRRPAAAQRIPFERAESPCSPATVPLVRDGRVDTRWRCERDDAQELTVDLGRVAPVAAIVQHLGPSFWEFPKRLDIETSHDGADWRPARGGSVLREVIEGGVADPRSLAVTLPFEPRPARFVRIRHRSFESGSAWAIAELEILGAP